MRSHVHGEIVENLENLNDEIDVDRLEKAIVGGREKLHATRGRLVTHRRRRAAADVEARRNRAGRAAIETLLHHLIDYLDEVSDHLQFLAQLLPQLAAEHGEQEEQTQVEHGHAQLELGTRRGATRGGR